MPKEKGTLLAEVQTESKVWRKMKPIVDGLVGRESKVGKRLQKWETPRKDVGGQEYSH